MQKDYCTEHFDMTGWFLVISLAKNIRKHFAGFNRNGTNTFLCSPGPCCWRRAWSRAERETGCSDLFVDAIKLLRPLKTTHQPTTGHTGLQSLEQDVHDFRALEGQLVAEMWDEIHSASGQHSWIFTNTELFLTVATRRSL